MWMNKVDNLSISFLHVFKGGTLGSFFGFMLLVYHKHNNKTLGVMYL
jgi:hypothetical protein